MLTLNQFASKIWDQINTPYPVEGWGRNEDDGTMLENVKTLEDKIVGRKIVSSKMVKTPGHYMRLNANPNGYIFYQDSLELTLDNGHRVYLRNTDDCCAFTEMREFLLHPESVDHVIMGVGTTDDYTTWHIFADFGDVMALTVEWSCGNPFYYGYGFQIDVVEDPAFQVTQPVQDHKE